MSFISHFARAMVVLTKRGIEMNSNKIGNVTCGLRELSDAELAMVGGAFNWLSVLEKAVVGTAAAIGGLIGGPAGAVVGRRRRRSKFPGAVDGAKYSGAGTLMYF
jgi:hypothetical protein